MKFELNRLAASLALVAASAAALPAHSAPEPSENATINLIRLLVQQGVLKPDQADALVAQAEAEAR
ncbi:MAG TPA: putative porin, partial [Achromobacter sp.]|uniref:putative porin n=1 Tax=Achromobacter sp. TaxID=134375 RepID=UPI002F945F19